MSEFQKKPEIVIFAGPNGSGKSIFTQLLKPPMDHINADEIKKYLSVWYGSAGRIYGGAGIISEFV